MLSNVALWSALVLLPAVTMVSVGFLVALGAYRSSATRASSERIENAGMLQCVAVAVSLSSLALIADLAYSG